MTATNDGHRQRLRERFERSGLQGFHDHEVLELVLTYAIPRKDVKPIAKRLVTKFGSLAAVFDASSVELEQVEGIGPYAAGLITIIPRLVDRYHQDRWKKQQITFCSTMDAVGYLAALLGTERNEVFCILALNSQNAMIAREIQRGSINRTAVFPRLVVEECLKHRATAVILAHNHPSGDPKPSTADRQLTRRLKKVLNDLDIVVHDHIIIAGPSHYSFAEQGELEA